MQKIQIKRGISLGMALIMFSLSFAPMKAEATGKPKLSVSKITLKKGKQKRLKLKNATNATVKWSVKGSAIKLSGKGKKGVTLKGVKAGTAVITAKVTKKQKNYILKCNATVQKVNTTKDNTVSEQETTTTASDDKSLQYYTTLTKEEYSGDNDTTAVELEESERTATIQLSDASTMVSYGIGQSGDVEVSKEDGFTKVQILTSGIYYVSGSLNSGCIDIGKNLQIKLVLDTVEVICPKNDTPALEVGGESHVVVTLQNRNLFSDEGAAVIASSDTSSEHAVIFGKKDSTVLVNGEGSLEVKAVAYNGIKGKGTVKIVDTTVSVSCAPNHGICAKELLGIQNSNVTVTDVAGDGLKATKGKIDLQGGITDITCFGDGIEAANSAYIAPETLKITTGSASTAGGKGIKVNSDDATLETYSVLEIAGGNIEIDSYDDSIHIGDSDNAKNYGTCVIKGGNLTLSAGYKNGAYVKQGNGMEQKQGNKGISAKNGLQINGAEVVIQITNSFEGMEADYISIIDCKKVAIVATDDGINVSGESTDNRFWGGNSTGNSDHCMVIKGGMIEVNAEGDGIDVNGSYYQYGGEVVVNGATGGGNGVLDYDGVFEISGGTLLGAGSTDMAQTPTDGSLQPSLSVIFSGMQSAGSTVSVRDKAGNTICSHTAKKNYQLFIVSDAALTLNAEYDIYVDETLVYSLTLTSKNMSYGQGNSNNGTGGKPGGKPGRF